MRFLRKETVLTDYFNPCRQPISIIKHVYPGGASGADYPRVSSSFFPSSVLKMAKYIDPFTDTGFKIIFGKEHVSNDILRSFLNVLFEGDPVLSDIKRVEYRPNEKITCAA